MTLKSYQAKRDFKKTAEPKGNVNKNKPTHRYLIQKHAASHLHYDFRLELNGVLKSWAIPKGPCLNPATKRLAVHVEDHPIAYGEFEGIIPAGEYGGGTVMLWDEGTWEPLNDNPKKSYQTGKLAFLLHGSRLKGAWELIRLKNDDPKHWLLFKKTDAFSHATKDVTKKYLKSVRTARTMHAIATRDSATWHSNKIKTLVKKSAINIGKNKAIPSKIKPQLATLVEAPPLGDEWLNEIKLDGYRIITILKNGKAKLFTRNGLDWSYKFPSLLKSFISMQISSAIFDGELCVLDDDGHTNFQLLQNAIERDTTQIVVYFCFDLIYLNGNNLCGEPLGARKLLLENVFKNIDANNILYHEHILGHAEEIFAAASELSLEGIVSKNIHSTYEQKRTKNWLKSKCIKREEFIITGFTKAKGSRKEFGALLLGFFNQNGQLQHCGRVGTGFSESSLQSIFQTIKKYATITGPYSKLPANSQHVTWLKPILVAEIEFTGWTQDQQLRHASFKGLRIDIKPRQVKKIAIESVSTTLSHPDKILYPKQRITKLMLANYYEAAAEWMLPYLQDRLLTIVRSPQGAEAKSFYQRHLTSTLPNKLLAYAIDKEKNREPYFYIKDAMALQQLVQLDVLEIHTWGSTIQALEKPNVIIFDLDPAPDISFRKLVAAAFELKNHLIDLELESFVKATGGKGLHVVVPIRAHHTWPVVKDFTHKFADLLTEMYPNKYIATMTKSKRISKIYIDYLRNQRGATAVCPYSTRALPNATIATPIHWDELTTSSKDIQFNLPRMLERLKSLKHDPWENYFKLKQSLKLK